MEALKGAGEVSLRAPRAVALYILNEKRGHLARLHADQGVFVSVVVDETLPHAGYAIERTSDEARPADVLAPRKSLEPYVPADEDLDVFEEEEEEEEEDDDVALEHDDENDEDDEDRSKKTVARKQESADGDDGREDRSDRRGRRRRRRGRRDGEPRPAAVEGEEPAEARAEDDDDGLGGRRRRRGRRGGRRSRDDGRPQDAYAWTRPWVPYEDDPFIWFDPSQDARRPAETPRAPGEAFALPAAPEAPAVDIWVELPEAGTEKPPRARRARARGRRSETVEAAVAVTDASILAEPVESKPAEIEDKAPEPVETLQPEPEAPEKPTRARRTRARAIKGETESASASASEAAPPVTPHQQAAEPAGAEAAPVEPEAISVREPDPSEITASPPQPRKGWWRRG
jgi:ribonuclease E